MIVNVALLALVVAAADSQVEPDGPPTIEPVGDMVWARQDHVGHGRRQRAPMRGDDVEDVGALHADVHQILIVVAHQRRDLVQHHSTLQSPSDRRQLVM